MIYLEIIVLLITVTTFFLQIKGRRNEDILAKKIVYWTLMLFVSIFFNSIVYAKYINNYNLKSYFTITSLIFIVGLLLGYVIIQIISPTNYLKYVISRFSKKDKVSKEDIINEDDEKNRQRLFEIFLETICWISLALSFSIDVVLNFKNNAVIEKLITENLSILVCLLLLVTIPICLRQILYYLFSIRKVKRKKIPEKYIALDMKLNKNNVIL